ncbi:beta strand repeat-containing protein [Mycolicibacterium sphagni]|uniref:beta strand repeat-containing protein n=1 Tax=Mycolicibacterium sphagni TaxID=1786 RepID=UPI0013FD5AF4|nr:Ig-like domain-containing protein [Mycolicibacterium sphagni]
MTPLAASKTSPLLSLLKVFATVLSLFGVNTQSPTAPANPISALLWGAFRQTESSLGVKPPVAGTPTAGPPDPTTGAVTGTLGFTDPGGQSLTYAVTGKPTQGAVSVDAAGNFTYTPTATARYAATAGTTDTFTITASNGVASTSETVIVSVSPLADKPVAGTPTVGTPNTSTGVVTGALNFTDPAGKALTYTVTTAPAQGAVTVTATGTFTYTPTATARYAATNATTDTFTVTASDGTNSTTETVTVSVSPLADKPVAGTPTVGTPNASTGVVTGALNFTDPGAKSLTYTVTTTPTQGTVSVDAAGNFTYTPAATARYAATNATTDTFTVSASDGTNSTTETVTVSVSPLPDKPVAGTPTVGTPDANGIVTGALNFTDPGAKTLTYTVTTTPTQGAVTVSPTGTFTYTPTTAARLAASPGTTDTFTITANDGTATTTETVTVSVSPLADTPVAGTPSIISTEPATGEVYGELNFTDTAGSSLTYAVTTNPTEGSVTSYGDLFVYAPTALARDNATSSTTDTFTVTATNTAGKTATETVTVSVIPDTPIAATPTVGAPNATTGVVTGTLNVTDPTGETLTYAVKSGPTQGTVAVTSAGQFTYTPTALALSKATSTSIDTFTISATNTSGQSATETVAVPIGTQSQAVLNAIGINGAAEQIAVAPNGKFAYVLSESSENYSAATGFTVTYTLSKVDTTSSSPTFGTVVATTDLSSLGSYISGLTLNSTGTQLYVVSANQGLLTTGTPTTYSSQLTVINTTTSAITNTIGLGANFLASSAVVEGANLYVAGDVINTNSTTDTPSYANAAVQVFNTTSNSLVTTITIPTANSDSALLTGFTATPDGTRLYAATLNFSSTGLTTGALSETVSVISPTTNTITNTFTLANSNSGTVDGILNLLGTGNFVADNSHLYTLSSDTSGNSAVTVLNTDGTVAGTIALPTGLTPTSQTLSPDGTTLYVAVNNSSATTNSSEVLVINTATDTITDAIVDNTTSGQETATTIAATADGTTLYIANAGTASTYSSSGITYSAYGNLTMVGLGSTQIPVGNGGAYDVPTDATSTVGAQNPTTGVVTGAVSFVDPAAKPLTYTVTTNGTEGSATVTSSGAFTYTPDTATTTTTDTFTVTATNAAGKTATEIVTVPVRVTDTPVAGTPTVGTPNATTGVVTGTLNFTDPAGSPLTYTVSSNGSQGTAVVASTGTFTYISSGNTTASTDTFTVTATNAFGNSATESVTVPVSSVTGTTTFSNDGTYALVSRYVGGTPNNTTYYALINTTTGTQVGSTITITGQVDDNFNPTFSPDNSNVLIGTWSTNGAISGDTNTTTYTVLSTTTGAVTATINLDGASAGPPTFSTNDTYALLSSYVGATTNNTTRYVLINTLTGAQIGTTLNITGQVDDNFNPTFSTDNSHVLIGTWSNSGETNTTTYTVLSTTTGAVTATVNLTGASAGPPTFSGDGTYALVTSYVGSTIYYALIDLLTGTQFGTTTTTPLQWPDA